MKILVTGAKGQLGHEICQLLGDEAIAVDITDVDITDDTAVSLFVNKTSPDAIVHCAAYTAVDKAESEFAQCHAVNVLGTKYLAEAAKNINAKFLYVSTDYVFDGALDRPYEIDDIPNPLGAYGRTKLDGEKIVRNTVTKHFIVRTSWVFGLNGGNFVKTMLRLGREHGKVRVVDDQIGSPTYAYDLAALLIDIIRSEEYGTYHATNDGFCSWYAFACAIFEAAEINAEVIPVPTADYPTLTVRPKNSCLSKQSLKDKGFELLPHYNDALERFIKLLPSY